MRKRARTDLCGGRSVMVVPTATIVTNQGDRSHAYGHGMTFLSHHPTPLPCKLKLRRNNPLQRRNKRPDSSV